MRIMQFRSWLLVCGMTFMFGSGCSSLGNQQSDTDSRFNLLKRLQNKDNEEPEYQTPKSMVAIWKASTFEKPGTKSIRGFGARFYFYDANNKPLRVTGDLTIYGYDDDNKEASAEGKADRKFVFSADTLNTHFSKSAFGESYSFWVPWDVVGGEEKTITLIPVFKSANGYVPEAKPSTLRLPGKPRKKRSDQSAVVQASAEIPTPAGTNVIAAPIAKQVGPRRAATTFRLPPSLAEQLSRPVNNRAVGQSATDVVGARQKSSRNETTESRENTRKKESSDQGPKKVSRAQPRERSPVFGQPGAFR